MTININKQGDKQMPDNALVLFENTMGELFELMSLYSLEERDNFVEDRIIVEENGNVVKRLQWRFTRDEED